MRTMRWVPATTSSAVVLLLGCLLASGGAVARAQEPAGGAPESLVVNQGAAPTLDGKVGAEEWKGAAVFEVGRGEDIYGKGYLRRAGRDLWIGYVSELVPAALGVRFNFREPVSKRRNMLLVQPLSPPQPPLAAFRRTAGRDAERVPASRAGLRFDFDLAEHRFSFELRVSLDLLEIGRNDRAYGFGVEVWDLEANRTIGVFPLGTRGLIAGEGMVRMRPQGDWGADEPVDAGGEPDPALDLLEQLEAERTRTRIGTEEVPHLLRAFLGWSDGKRRVAPLAELDRRLVEAIRLHPDFVSLSANRIWSRLGLNDLEGALASHDRISRDFELLVGSPPHFLLRSELLRNLGRYEEALADLEGHPGYLADNPASLMEIRLLKGLIEAWRMEQAIRAEESARDDLPRVKLKTNRGAIVLELFEDDAPNAVANFVSLVERGFYNGTRFHWVEGGRRVIGGDPNSMNKDPNDDGFGGPGYMIESEPSRRLNFQYAVAFADGRGTRRTEGSAFVIHIAPFPALDGVDSVFGRVVEGFEAVRALEYYDELESATVLRKRRHAYEPVRR